MMTVKISLHCIAKDEIMNLFQTSTTDKCSKPERVNNMYMNGGQKNRRKQSEDKIIKAVKGKIIRYQESF